MKKFIKKLSLFALPIAFYLICAIIWLPDLLQLKNGPNTERQILYATANAVNNTYNLLILGNSRTYRGLNPDQFSCETLNYSHDNDSYNQIYYKLKMLEPEKRKHLKAIVLGVDYFQFNIFSEKRNAIYGKVLGEDYLKDYKNSNIEQKGIFDLIRDASPKNLLRLENKENKPILRSNGQYIVKGKANELDFVVRSIDRLKIQSDYFGLIVDLCKEVDIKCFIVMPPARPEELTNYTAEEIVEFNSFVNRFVDNKSIFYLNYSTTNRFSMDDYTDITHLNEKAADVFSTMLDSNLVELGLDCSQ